MKIIKNLTAVLTASVMAVAAPVTLAADNNIINYCELSDDVSDNAVRNAYLIGRAALMKNAAVCGNEWNVFALARGEYAFSDEDNTDFYKEYYTSVENAAKDTDGAPNGEKATDYARTVIALTAIGEDPENLAGYNMLESLADMDLAAAQGVNGLIYTLLALDTNAYDIPQTSAENPTTREKLISRILALRIKGEVWGWFGTPEIDLTAMAVQSLAPYYEDDENVRAAVDTALEYLSEQQLESGGYINSGAENSESAAQVLAAICSLGIDPDNDQRFIKNGNTLPQVVAEYAKAGGFSHIKGKVVNAMATQQCTYALAAYYRFRDGKTSLYDMSDVTEEPSEEPEVTTEPSEEPEVTTEPTEEPSEEPEATAEPTTEPTATPSEEPTVQPSTEPTATPTAQPDATSKPSSGGGGGTSSSEDITVYMTVEKLTLGQGFITEPMATVVKSDTTCAQLLDTILGDGNYKYTGQINDGMYLTSIRDSEENVDIPSYISQKAGTIGKRRSGEWLSELDYTNMAGWMYSVNDKFPSETASSKTLKDGDVIRWQFTIYGYGADIGKDSSSFGIPSLKTLADKKKLIKLVADLRQEYKDSELKQNAEYVAALDALAKIDSTQSEIDSAYKALDKADFSEGSESGSGSSSKKVSVGISFSEVKNEDESTIVTAKITTTADNFNVALDKAAIAKLAEKAQCLKIRAGKTDIVIPQAVFKSLSEVSEDGAELEIDHTSQKSRDNIKVSFTNDNEKLDVKGEIHIELPFDAGEFEDCVTVRGGAEFNYENGIVSLEIQPNTEYNTVISPIGRLKDVPSDAEYAEALDSLMEKGIIKGVGNGYFEPDGRFTTGMLAAMMYRQSGHETSGIAWYVAPMEWAVGNGYLKSGDSFMSVDADIMNYAMKLFLKKDDFSAHGGEMTRAEGTLNYFRFTEGE